MFDMMFEGYGSMTFLGIWKGGKRGGGGMGLRRKRKRKRR